MKKNIIKALLPIALLTSMSHADYSIKIYLDENSLKINDQIEVTPPDEGENNPAPEDVINGDVWLSSTTINRGQSSTLNWDYEKLTNFNLSGGYSYSSNSSSGSLNLTPDITSNYLATVTNGSKSENKNLRITVIQPDPVITFNANEYQIGEGESVTLSWNVLNADSASIDNGIGAINLNSQIDVSPVSNTTYILNAIGYNGEKTDSKSVSIEVIKNSNINSFIIDENKTNYTVGEKNTFYWDVTGSKSLELVPYGPVANDSDRLTVSFDTAGTFDYKLRSTNFNNSITESSPIRINVYGKTTIDSFNFPAVKANSPATFSWTGSNVVNYKIRSNNAASGIPTTDVDLGLATSRSITPTAAGSYIYTLTATNAAGYIASRNQPVTVAGGRECKYDSKNYWYVSFEDQSQSTGAVIEETSLVWNGVGVKYDASTYKTSFTVGGYTYTRSTLQPGGVNESLYSMNYYAICRE